MAKMKEGEGRNDLRLLFSGVKMRVKPFLLPKNVLYDIGAHLQGFGPQLFGVVMHIVPTIAKIRFEIVVANESALINQAKSLRGLAVVLMDFG